MVRKEGGTRKRAGVVRFRGLQADRAVPDRPLPPRASSSAKYQSRCLEDSVLQHHKSLGPTEEIFLQQLPKYEQIRHIRMI